MSGLANLLILTIADVLYFVQAGVKAWYVVIFSATEITAIALYIWPAITADRPWAKIIEAMNQEGLVDDQAAFARERRQRKRPPWLTSLRAGAVVNFAGVIFLIYATGGPIISPFASVPLAMLIAGQILLRPGRIDLKPFRIIEQVIRVYRFPLLLAFLAYSFVFSLDHYSRLDVRSAPRWEYFLVTVINVIYTTIITMISRAGALEAPDQ